MTDVEFKSALAGQYRAALTELQETIRECPDDLWLAGKHPRHFWRIAYHALYYTDLYLEQKSADFKTWPKHASGVTDLWGDTPSFPAYSKQDLDDYAESIKQSVGSRVTALDIDAKTSGFSYYKNTTKLEHVLINLRHVQEHVGQLRDRLLENGHETDWLGKR